MMRDWIAERTANTKTRPPLQNSIPFEKIAELQAMIENVIRGKSETVKFALVALLAKGHLLIEDVPGIGKTTLAQRLARALDLSIQRIQFTSDLLPSDVIGLSIFNQQSGEFEWKPGPIFSNIVLADEINRATPKTQSALLEAMAEEQVTVDGMFAASAAAVYGDRDAKSVRTSRHISAARIAARPLYAAAAYGLSGLGDERQILRDRENDRSARILKAVVQPR